MRKICFVTGNRSDWGLIEPLVNEMKYGCDDIEVSLIITGAHLSKKFGETSRYISNEYNGYICPILVDYDNPIGICQSQAMGLMQFPGTLANLNPECLVILGDRFEMLSAAIAAYNLGIKIAHIQNDDITNGSLDNGYRKCINQLATYRFPVSEYGSLGCVFPKIEPMIDLFTCDYIIIVHPNNDINFNKIYHAVKYFKNVVFIGCNPDAGHDIIQDGLRCAEDNGHYYFESVDREFYLSLLKGAKCIIGNSSSGIIEAPSLETPTVNIGNRQDGRLKAESIIDCECDTKQIIEAIKKAREIKFPVFNPYSQPNTVDNIINFLRKQ